MDPLLTPSEIVMACGLMVTTIAATVFAVFWRHERANRLLAEQTLAENRAVIASRHRRDKRRREKAEQIRAEIQQLEAAGEGDGEQAAKLRRRLRV